jgi:hypothetical protein
VKSFHAIARARPPAPSCALPRCALAVLAAGCMNLDTPHTSVDFENGYPASSSPPPVLYRAYWGNVSLPAPLVPGDSSGPQSAVPASDNTAYAVLAPGWDADASARPASLVALLSRSPFALHLDDTVHIPVDDTTFAGNCAAGSMLTQAQADFITQIVFPDAFAGTRYDAVTCTATPIGDAGTE